MQMLNLTYLLSFKVIIAERLKYTCFLNILCLKNMSVSYQNLVIYKILTADN